jgi:hypothetical protein
MDPITAIGFASSILTFVEFSWNLISGTCEIYTSPNGSTSENAHISHVIKDFRKVTHGLDSDFEGNSRHEKALHKLASKCAELSQELLELLRRLKVKEGHSKWRSFQVKWASMRKHKDVESMESRLREYRSQILIRLNLMLR